MGENFDAELNVAGKMRVSFSDAHGEIHVETKDGLYRHSMNASGFNSPTSAMGQDL